MGIKLLELYGGEAFFVLIFCCFVLLMTFGMNAALDSELGLSKRFWRDFSISLLSFAVFVLSAYMYYYGKDARIAAWSKSVAEPAVASLPEKTSEVQVLQIGPKKEGTDLRRVVFRFSGSETEETTEALIEERPQGAPVLAYKELKKRLGPGYEKGMIGTKLSVPNVKLEWTDRKEAPDISGAFSALGQIALALFAAFYLFHAAVFLGAGFINIFNAVKSFARVFAQKEASNFAQREVENLRSDNASLRRQNASLSAEIEKLSNQIQRLENPPPAPEKQARKRFVRA